MKTLVLGREEESVRVEQKHAGFENKKGLSDASFKIYKGVLFAFKKNNSSAVFCFRLGDPEWKKYSR